MISSKSFILDYMKSYVGMLIMLIMLVQKFRMTFLVEHKKYPNNNINYFKDHKTEFYFYDDHGANQAITTYSGYLNTMPDQLTPVRLKKTVERVSHSILPHTELMLRMDCLIVKHAVVSVMPIMGLIDSLSSRLISCCVLIIEWLSDYSQLLYHTHQSCYAGKRVSVSSDPRPKVLRLLVLFR